MFVWYSRRSRKPYCRMPWEIPVFSSNEFLRRWPAVCSGHCPGSCNSASYLSPTPFFRLSVVSLPLSVSLPRLLSLLLSVFEFGIGVQGAHSLHGSIFPALGWTIFIGYPWYGVSHFLICLFIYLLISEGITTIYTGRLFDLHWVNMVLFRFFLLELGITSWFSFFSGFFLYLIPSTKKLLAYAAQLACTMGDGFLISILVPSSCFHLLYCLFYVLRGFCLVPMCSVQCLSVSVSSLPT